MYTLKGIVGVVYLCIESIALLLTRNTCLLLDSRDVIYKLHVFSVNDNCFTSNPEEITFSPTIDKRYTSLL